MNKQFCVTVHQKSPSNSIKIHCYEESKILLTCTALPSLCLQELKVKLLGQRKSVKICVRSFVPWPSETFLERPLWCHVAFVRDNRQFKHSDRQVFSRCPYNPNPLINTIGNYSLTDLQSQYPKYIHKHPKHILL